MGGSSTSSSLWVALPTAAAAAVLIYLLVPDERQRAIRRLPAPASTLPVLGNTLDLMSLELPRLHDWITEQCKAFGGRTWRLQVLGAPPVVVVSSVECFEDVLKTQFEVFDKGHRMNNIFRDVAGGGIVAVDGPQWAAQRKMLSRLFTMRAFRETISQCVHDYTLVLGRSLNESARTGVPIDFADVMHRFSFDVFTDISFGLQANSLESGEHTQFMEAMAKVVHNLEMRFHSPDWFWKLKRALKLGSEKEVAEEVAILDKMVFTIINKNMERTRVYIPSYTLGRMKSVWGRDASKFKPERWLMQDPWTGELTIRPVSAFQFVSFHAGPRTCLGMRFAMLEMKTVTAYMLSKYHFTTKENPKSYTYDVASVLQIKGPLIVKVQRAG
ncbi:Cytochrome P450, conserved site [Phytophthora cactorum]|nr:Cytochrome P450, conserved site [Phytophthora cactorum]